MFVPDRFRIWDNKKKITAVISYKSLAFSFCQVLAMYGKNESYIRFQCGYVEFLQSVKNPRKKYLYCCIVYLIYNGTRLVGSLIHSIS